VFVFTATAKIVDQAHNNLAIIFVPDFVEPRALLPVTCSEYAVEKVLCVCFFAKTSTAPNSGLMYGFSGVRVKIHSNTYREKTVDPIIQIRYTVIVVVDNPEKGKHHVRS
jgi:hypothetical protein